VFEAAVQKRKSAGLQLTSLEDFIDNVSEQQQLLRRINELRIEVDRYNVSSAENRFVTFQGVQKYVQNVHSDFIQMRLSIEIPQLFDNLVSTFTQSTSLLDHSVHPGASSAVPPSMQESSLSLQCAARVGLETVRIWRQLELNHCHPNIDQSIYNFEQRLMKALEHQPVPSVIDADALNIYRVSNATVVLYFDHLHHDTPEDHVETQSRVSTCMRAIRDRMHEEQRKIDMDRDDAVPDKRQLVILNCNDVVSPPLWCLPLAHSPRYLSQLWKLSDEAQRGDLYVPLEFDTEWISEDPYHTSSDEEEASRVKMSRSAVPTAVLMRTIEMDPSWCDAFKDSACREAFTKTLTPVGADFLVNKVISKMEQKANQKITRTQKQAVNRSKAEKDNDGATNKSTQSLKANSSASRASIAQALRDREVKTPYGIGKIVEQLRSDHLVAVRLQWGAVGYFRKDCIEYSGGQHHNDWDDDKLFYSAAQAVYVMGSGEDRFTFHNMSLHNVAARVIHLVKTQRLVSEKLSCSHANLSLYMHGRSSAGLTTTVEAALTRWIDTADKNKFMSLLAQAEAIEAQEGVCLDDGFFMKELNRLIKERRSSVQHIQQQQQSLTSVVAAKQDLKPVCIANDRSVSTTKQQEVKPITHKTIVATAVGSPSGSSKQCLLIDDSFFSMRSPLKSIVADRSTSFSPGGRLLKSFSMDPDEAVSPMVSSPQLSTKSLTDPKLSAKYSPEGQILRELVLAVMQKLRMSQSSLPNDLYRRYRYETSHSIVSSWFAFRDSKDSFEHMTRCILIWMEDHRSHLSDEDQSRLVRVNELMDNRIRNASSNRQGGDDKEEEYRSDLDMHSDADSTIRFDRDADWQDFKMRSSNSVVVARMSRAVSDEKTHDAGHPMDDSLIAVPAVLDSGAELVDNVIESLNNLDPLVRSDILEIAVGLDDHDEVMDAAVTLIAHADDSIAMEGSAAIDNCEEQYEADDDQGGTDSSDNDGDELLHSMAAGDELVSSIAVKEELLPSMAVGDELISSSSFGLMMVVFEEGLLDAINDVLVSVFDEIKVIIEGEAMVIDDAEDATGDSSRIMVIDDAGEMEIDAYEETGHLRNGVVVDTITSTELLAHEMTHDRCDDTDVIEEVMVGPEEQLEDDDDAHRHYHRLAVLVNDDANYFHADEYCTVNNTSGVTFDDPKMKVEAVDDDKNMVDADEEMINAGVLMTDVKELKVDDAMVLDGLVTLYEVNDHTQEVVGDAVGELASVDDIVAVPASDFIAVAAVPDSTAKLSEQQLIVVNADNRSTMNLNANNLLEAKTQHKTEKDKIGVAITAAAVAEGPSKESITGASTAVEQGQIIPPTSEPKAVFPYDKVTVDLIITINDLHMAVRFELNRRQITVLRASEEAKLKCLGIGLKDLTDFLALSSIMNNERGRLFTAYMIKSVVLHYSPLLLYCLYVYLYVYLQYPFVYLFV